MTAVEGPATLEVVNPATGELITTVPATSAEDVTKAAERAEQVFASGVWSGRPVRERSALARAGRLLAKPRDLCNLIVDSDDPQRFERRCFTLIAVGHIIGLLGAARA